MNTVDRSPRTIFLFWLPLVLQWIMMAMEGPFLAAVIARLADPTFNLAAYGVAFAFAILVESPVIMLMSASIALVEDRASYLKLRAFAWLLNGLSTALLLLVLIPPVFDLVLRAGLGLPPEVADLVYGSLWILLPWPAAIGYRRFVHGILIRAGRTRLVAWGTAIRLGVMALTGAGLALFSELPGAWIGAAALSAGVVVEALVAWGFSLRTIGELEEEVAPAPEAPGEPSPTSPAAVRAGGRTAAPGTGPARALARIRAAVHRRPAGSPPAGRGEDAAGSPPGSAPGGPPTGALAGALPTLSFPHIARFYYPLALTSLIGLTTQPILTFFMGRAPAPVESLAVFPVVMALYFLFASFGLSFQEAAIALVGKRGEHRKPLARFGVWLGLAASGGLAVIAFTPAAVVWFEGISGLDPELARLAYTPARIVALGPALIVLTGFQRALLVQARRTRPITVATALEVTVIAIVFPALGWGLGWLGVTAAMTALVVGRAVGASFLVWRVRGLEW
ncbi:MAG: hypothetical protein EA352_11310 [Gemmatimonadales bacterium]|nr:MAG: hypothetical protein EA352_11310 [Gemmatimonadales bacterium]